MSKNVYVKNGCKYIPVNSEQLKVLDTLPGGVYSIERTMQGYIFNMLEESFTVPEKIYGETKRYADRIIKTYKDRETSTGVLLMGNKGSGKTLLAKYISNLCGKEGFITLVINAGLCGDDFNAFIQAVDQPCIIIFDEFEKVYDDWDQECLLTVFDGVFCQKKLFILTCNDIQKVNDNMLNRPGRMYYAIPFEGITAEFTREYCVDNLKNKSQIEEVVTFIETNNEFSFDMLQTLVEEMNRYGESAKVARKLLNINN